MAVSYDLNEIADALADVFGAVDSWVVDGETAKVVSTAEALGTVNPPAIVIELDDITWDVSMGRGADTFVFVAYLIASNADSPSGQRLIRQLLSTGGIAAKLKDALEADSTLSGLVSYAHMAGTRTIGAINYSGVGYLGAVLEIVVMS